MDIGKAFGFVFEDEQWITKVGLGGLILLIPIVGQIVVIGYMLKVAQNVAQGNPRPLPEWSEFGDHLMRGLYGVIIQIVYFIPYIVVYGIFICITAGLGSAASSEEQGGAIALLSLCLLPLIFIVALVCLVFAYGGLARYVASNNLSDALKFGEVIAMVRSRPGTWLMLVLVAFLSGLLAAAGIIACGIGVLFTSVIAYGVQGHALGQVVRQVGLAGGGYTETPPAGYAPPPSY